MNNHTFSLITYRTVTPLHVGCGQDVGVVDLPVIRERATGLPFIPGSGIRGALRDLFENHSDTTISAMTERLFGPDSNAHEHAGCISVLDAHPVLFPVRSDRELFQWITCPFILRRFADLNHRLALAPPVEIDITVPEGDYMSDALSGAVYLEEFPFTKSTDRELAKAWDEVKTELSTPLPVLGNNVLLVSDKNFRFFTTNATIVQQHNRLDAAKTVENRGLFSIECLPPETVFAGFIGATDERTLDNAERLKSADVTAQFRKAIFDDKAVTHLILGGKESTGLGVTEVRWGA